MKLLPPCFFLLELDQGSAWVRIQHVLIIKFWKVFFTQVPRLLTASFVSKVSGLILHFSSQAAHNR